MWPSKFSIQYPAARFLGNAAVETGGKKGEDQSFHGKLNQIAVGLVKGLNKEGISSAWLWWSYKKEKSLFLSVFPVLAMFGLWMQASLCILHV